MTTDTSPAQWHRAHAAYSGFAQYLVRALQGQPIGDVLSIRVARLFWQQAVEDTCAIGCLIEKRFVGSTRALIRPQFESLARGAWVLRCADEATVQAIVDYQNQFPMLHGVVQALTSLKEPFAVVGGAVPFDQLASRSRDAMNDLTHRGTRALARRSIANAASSSIDDDEISLFHLGASIGGIAGAAFLESTGNPAGAQQLIDQLVEAAQTWGGFDHVDWRTSSPTNAATTESNS